MKIIGQWTQNMISLLEFINKPTIVIQYFKLVLRKNNESEETLRKRKFIFVKKKIYILKKVFLSFRRQ